MGKEIQARAPMSEKEKILRLEMALERVVHRLEGEHAEFAPFLFQTMYGTTREMLADVFMNKRQKFLRARRFVEDAVFMLGQIARRINSYLLPRIVALHLDLKRLWLAEGGKCRDEEEARRIVHEFEHCHDALRAEISFMDVRERADIWPKAPEHPGDLMREHEEFEPEKGMTEEEATQGSRAAALRNHRRDMRMTGFATKVASLTSCFSRLADDAQRGVASVQTVHSPDWKALSEVLEECTWIVYCEFHDMDLYFCHDPKRTNGYDDIGYGLIFEETEDKDTKQKMEDEIIRYVDAAIALARSVKSESASGFVLVKSLFEKYKGDFDRAEQSLAVKADLATFIDTLKSSRERLGADVAAATLGGERPLEVELTKKSGETIAKAVRPGRGGARRIFSEEVQEKCWQYWEAGRKNPDVAQIAESSGRKLRHEDVFSYFRRELAALEPPIDTPEAFRSVLRARTNRISRKKSH